MSAWGTGGTIREVGSCFFVRLQVFGGGKARTVLDKAIKTFVVSD